MTAQVKGSGDWLCHKAPGVQYLTRLVQPPPGPQQIDYENEDDDEEDDPVSACVMTCRSYPRAV